MRVLAGILVLVFLLAGCSGPIDEQKTQTPAEEEPDAAAKPQIAFQDEKDIEVEPASCEDEDPGLVLTVREPGGVALHGYYVSVLSTEFDGATDAAGKVAFSDIEPGRYTIRIDPADEWYKVTEANVTVQETCLTRATVTMPLKDGLLTPPHIHDDWKGRKEFELFTMEFDYDCVFGPLQHRCVDGQGNPAGGRHVFPETVPLGTGWLNVTADFEATGSEYLVLQINRPSVTGASFILYDEEPITFDTEKYQLSDVPHASQSRWNFAFNNGYPAEGVSVVEGPIEITVTVARSPEPLELDPPHPDFWGDRTQIVLADIEDDWGETTFYWNPDASPTSSSVHEFDEGKLVFPGTKEIRFTAWINDTLDRDATMELWYGFHSGPRTQSLRADQYTVVEADTSDGVRYDWVLPVPESMYDNLYKANASYFDYQGGGEYSRGGQAKSDWRFHIRPASMDSSVYFAYDGGADMHLIATAYKQ